MRLWGLTGGIASGKSAVSALVRRAGVPTVDADATYHRLLAPSEGRPAPLARAIADKMGGALLLPDGRLDRAALGRRAFADEAARQMLMALTHPAIRQAVQGELAALRDAGTPLAVYDVPLLFERDMAAMFAGVAVVWLPEALQVTRLQARDGCSEPAARARLAAQLSLAEKRRRADWVIDNSGSAEDLARQVTAWVAHMRGG